MRDGARRMGIAEDLVPHPPRADARRPPPTDVGGNPPLLIGRCGSGFGVGARLLFLASKFLQNLFFRTTNL